MDADPGVQPDRSAPVVPSAHMSGRYGRRRIARVIGLTLGAALISSACAAGQLAQTADQKASIDGVDKSLGSIDLRAVAIQAPQTGTPAYRPGTAAQLIIVFVNDGAGPDTLTSITSPAIGGWAAFSNYVDAFHVEQARNAALNASGSNTPGPPPSDLPTTAQPSSAQASSGLPLSTPPPSARATSPGSPTGSRAPTRGANPSSPGPVRRSATGTTLPVPSVSPSAPLPTGTRSVALPRRQRVSFGTPDATGALLLLPITQILRPGTTVPITFTFSGAGSITFAVPVQLGTSIPEPVGGPSQPPGG